MGKIVTSTSLKPPEGGRIHIVRVPVDPSRDWQEAIDAAGPVTPTDGDARKIGGSYRPGPSNGENEEQEHEIILVNFGRPIPDYSRALDWAKLEGLSPADPRQVFAVGEHKPKLRGILRRKSIRLFSLVPCSFGDTLHVLSVWWRAELRGVDLYWFNEKFIEDDCWFAFFRE